ncbi:MAG: hypothetical protein OXG27_00350 [Chloroflexi bacterium]|nr:hypothetical protein [Chloroflexota bacterium]
MKRRFALTLVVSFAGGILLTAGIGGALGIFDRGPTEVDVSDARERGWAEAQAEVGLGKDAAAAEREEEGFQRGREAAEWLSLDRLPNPDGWFAGVEAGRKQLEALAQEAFQAGIEDGERMGREEALLLIRMSGEEAPGQHEGDAPAGNQ